MAVLEDDIIRKKLLIEGDGGNDDKRIGNLLKTFVKWCNSNETGEESNMTYQRMLSQLAQVEFASEKSKRVYEMNLKEQQNYDMLSDKIEKSIEGAHVKITDCKNELQKAKRIRRNRQEYDALAKVIQQHPDRQDTLRQLETLDKELHDMKETKESLDQKLELRRKQFHVLITAIHELQRILDEDEQTEDQEMDIEIS